MIEAKVLADSINSWGDRIISFQVTCPRNILCEINTHLTVSKNTASSRAIPVTRRIANIRENPAIPVWFGANQPGMQASSTHPEELKARELWLRGAKEACDLAEELAQLGIHKGVSNRVAEPYAHVTACLTASEFGWGNWDWLRCSKDADATFDELAGQMLDAKLRSTPERLQPGMWHLPYDMGYEHSMDILQPNNDLWMKLNLTGQAKLIHGTMRTLLMPYFDWDGFGGFQKLSDIAIHGLHATWLRILVSVSKCGRVSYETQDREYTPSESIDHVIDKIIGPNHCSPLQHQHQCVDLDFMRSMPLKKLKEACRPDWSHDYEPIFYDINNEDFWWGNGKNWRQLRKLIRGEVAQPSREDQESIHADWLERRQERGYHV